MRDNAVKDKLKEFDQRLEVLKKKGEVLGAESKLKYNELLNKMKGNRDSLGDKIDNIRESGSENIEKLKKELDKGMDDMNQAYEELKDYINEKMEDSDKEKQKTD